MSEPQIRSFEITKSEKKMKILLIIAAFPIIIFILFFVLPFIRYKRQLSRVKFRLEFYITSGMNLLSAIKKDFSELNDSLPNKLDTNTVMSVVNQISSLQNRMDVDNVMEIYSTFVYRYICRHSNRPHPNVTNDKINYALNNMELDERNGYFTLKPDSSEEIDKKCPQRVL